MKFEIIEIEEIILVGQKIITTLSANNTTKLWQQFMSRHKEVKNRANDFYYSIQDYGRLKFEDFTPETDFTKWAAVSVERIGTVPQDMQTKVIPSGKYAKFLHKGTASDFYRTSQYIYGTWLPSSEYSLDQRPHFEILSSNYNGLNDPNSREDVFIPIK